MSLHDFIEKVKLHVVPFYNLILIVVVSGIFFALGRLSAIEERHTPIRVEYPNNTQTGSVVGAVPAISTATENDKNSIKSSIIVPQTTGGQVIGSKSGKKYYFPWCSTVKRIKPENQVPFASVEAARAAGFTAGGNCKGLE